MTNRYSFFLIAFVFIPCFAVAQNLTESINTIATHLKTVEASKVQFVQELKTIASEYVIVTVTEVDSKGGTDKVDYEFSFSDVNKNTVKTVTKKDIIQVQLFIKGKQKLIKKSEDEGQKVSYVDELFLYAKDINNGRDLVESIKETIPLNEEMEKNKLSLSTYNACLEWLMKNVTNVNYLKKQYTQSVSTDNTKNGHAKLETIENAKGKSVSSTYEFNFAMLNPNSVNFNIRGDEFSIEVENERKIKSIKSHENNVQQNFTDHLRFYASSIENGKDIRKVLKAIIPLAEKAFLKSMPNISKKSNAMDYLNSKLASISAKDKGISQALSDDCVTNFNQKISTAKAEERHEYVFNFIDINSNNINYDSQHDLLFVTLSTNRKNKYIKHIENGALKDYTYHLRIYVNSIEEAMIAEEALKTIISECKASEKTYDGLSVKTCMDKLSEHVGVVQVNSDNYDQSIEVVDEAANIVKFTKIFSDTKKSDEQVFEFGMNDINPMSIMMETNGNHVVVEMTTKRLEKIVKTYKNGDIKSYGNRIVIEASTIENAREIVNLLRVAAKG